MVEAAAAGGRMKGILFVVFLFTATQIAAQVPATVHAVWNPNPVSDNVVQYLLTVDAAVPVVVPASSCSVTSCGPTLLTVGAFGLHTVTIVAQNLKLSTDPTSLQSGPALSIPFTLGAIPVVVANGKVIN
jgi:hypothetical protein